MHDIPVMALPPASNRISNSLYQFQRHHQYFAASPIVVCQHKSNLYWLWSLFMQQFSPCYASVTTKEMSENQSSWTCFIGRTTATARTTATSMFQLEYLSNRLAQPGSKPASTGWKWIEMLQMSLDCTGQQILMEVLL